jgi:hypothetical protein
VQDIAKKFYYIDFTLLKDHCKMWLCYRQYPFVIEVLLTKFYNVVSFPQNKLSGGNMKKRNLFITILITFVMLASTLACKLFVPATPEAAPTMAPIPTIEAISGEPIEGLEGFWQDTETQTVHTIVWDGNQYFVASANNPGSGSYEVTTQSWDNGKLSWTYYVEANDTSVTFDTIAVAGDSLFTNWSNSLGDSGTETLERVQDNGSVVAPPIQNAVGGEAVPGLTGVWEDPETGTLHTVIWNGTEYFVVSSLATDGEIYDITDQSWSGDTLTWTYYVNSTQVSVTFDTIYVDGNSLYTNWSNSDGNSGTETLDRAQ